MDAADDALDRKKLKLLQQVAELEVEQQRRRGMLDKVPHFSEIDDAGQNLGRLLSCLSQSRLASEVAAGEPAVSTCPTCGQSCRLEVHKRTVTGLDGPVEMITKNQRRTRHPDLFVPRALPDSLVAPNRRTRHPDFFVIAASRRKDRKARKCRRLPKCRTQPAS